MRIGTRIFSSVSTKSLVFGVVIVFACIAFIFTGFGSLRFGNLGAMSPSTAATAGSVNVEMSELINYMNEQGLSRVPEAQKKYAVAQVLKQLISQKILANESLKIGWQASDGEIASAIKAVPQFQDTQTHAFSLPLFKNFLANQQSSEVDFYNYLRTQLEIQKMQNLVFMPVVIPDSVAKLQYNMNNTQFNLQYAVVNLPENILEQKVAEQAKKFVENKANLKQLQDAYATQKNKFNQKEKIRVRSILIGYKGANRAQGSALERTKENALKLTQNAYTQIKKGSSFATLAKENNDDLTAQENKGDIGFVDDSSIDSASLKAISVLNKQNPLSNIVDTPFGYRIFQYEETKPAVHKNFEEAKLEIAKQIVGNNMRTTEENNFQVQLTNAVVAQNITQLNALLTSNGVAWQYLSKPFKVTDTELAGLGNASKLAEEIFSVKKSGQIISKIIDFGTKKALIKLDSISEPASPNQADLETLKQQMTSSQVQLFVQNTTQYLNKNYEKEGKIKINPILNE
ncbi:MAG: SurA N-terminal domain-containing protein [Bdellovibrionota bacterium]